MPILSRRVPDSTTKITLQPSEIQILPIPQFLPEIEDDLFTNILTRQTNYPRVPEQSRSNPFSLKVSEMF